MEAAERLNAEVRARLQDKVSGPSPPP